MKFAFGILAAAMAICALSCHRLESRIDTSISIDLTHPGPAFSPTMYGIFFEDIHHAADGGLYAELIHNRDF